MQFPRRPRPRARSSRPGALGAFCARHPVWVIAAWLVLLAGALLGRHAVGPAYSDGISLPSTRSRTGADLLAAYAPGVGDPHGRVVFHVDSGTVADHRQAVDESLAALAELPHVTAASKPTGSETVVAGWRSAVRGPRSAARRRGGRILIRSSRRPRRSPHRTPAGGPA
ncbi:hypothetical protein OS965_09960 [Streptomyces sp. H27-G5]|uniref:hypothetical protein n=1 Tax=Streptomyces sp. H27-G5 TaxID=2996698 RepID=UPI002271CA88|nr:hypothetical protein [Streptomyces sp. H27-G5]MCY0918497.1 hypothetical protein [Streptomyces sp. H27-G5]